MNLKQIAQSIQKMARAQNLQSLDISILEALSLNIGVTGGSYFNVEKDYFSLIHSLDGSHVPEKIKRPVKSDSVYGKAIAEQKPFIIEDIEIENSLIGSSWKGYLSGAVLVVPLLGKNKILNGIISLHNKIDPPFTPEDLELATILISSYGESREFLTLKKTSEDRESLFCDLIDRANDFFCIVDRQNHITYVNQTSLDKTGYKSEEILGKHSQILIHPDDYEKNRENRLNLLKGDNITYDARLMTSSGQCVSLNVHSVPIMIDGRYEGNFAIGRDMTGEIESAKILRQSELKYRYLFDHTPVFHVIFDQNGVIREINDYFHVNFPDMNNSIVGTTLWEFPGLKNRSMIEDYTKKIIRGATQDYNLEVELLASTGDILTFLYLAGTGIPFYEKGDQTGFLVSFIDITKRKQDQRMLLHQEQLLFQASKLVSLGTLVAGVAHEINNPNNYIKLNVQNLRDFWTDIEAVLGKCARENDNFSLRGIQYNRAKDLIRQLLNGIEKGSMRIEKILESLKNYARKDGALKDQDVDIYKVFQSSLQILESLIANSTTRFMYSYSLNIPDFKGNYHQIEQVLINLISNACQSLESKNQGIDIAIGFDKSENMIIIRIRDEGIGIPRESLNQILDPFYTTKRDEGGTGLGLSVSYQIVKKHGGELDFKSIEGTGTEAILKLPLC